MIGFFVLFLCATLFLGCTPQREAGNNPLITITVAFEPALKLPGVTKREVLDKLYLDFYDELSPDIDIVVEESTTNYIDRYKAGIRKLMQDYGAEQARQRIEDLTEKSLSNTSDLEDATAEYYQAMAKVEQEMAASLNLAGMSQGNLGLLIVSSDGYGGRTAAGEKWSVIYAGFLNIDFPPASTIQSGEKGIIDYSDESFDAYRSTYTEQRRKEYVLQYLANAAKREIGHQFWLPDSSGDLSDAMCADIDRQKAEHFQHDANPAHYHPYDRDSLIIEMTEWALQK